jgi:2-polyprenyl-6-methoxyphenol hydroxylase-like FAD-dependent oxidoreductase
MSCVAAVPGQMSCLAAVPAGDAKSIEIPGTVSSSLPDHLPSQNSMTNVKASAEILIVGAGPVGLLLAAELRRDGVDVLLIEQMAQRTFFCKALGVTARTLEIFEDLGLVEEAIDAGVWLTGITVFNDGKPAQAMEVPTAGLPYGALSLAQFETERLLEEGLHRRGGAVAYGWSLTGLVEQTEGVVAQLQSLEGHRQEVRCRWLVGCDGAHSNVRHLLNLNFEGSKFPQTFMLADLEVTWDLPRGPMYRFNQTAGKHPATSLVAVPVHGLPQRYRLSMIVPEPPGASAQGEAEEAASPDLGEITERMTPLLPAGTGLAALRWSSRYRVSHRIVPAYSKGRIFLAGDSAHIHPPVGNRSGVALRGRSSGRCGRTASAFCRPHPSAAKSHW